MVVMVVREVHMVRGRGKRGRKRERELAINLREPLTSNSSNPGCGF